MSKKLVDFLIDVAGDTEKRKALKADPVSVLNEYDLSTDEKGSIIKALHDANAGVDGIKKHLSPADQKKLKGRHGGVTINCIG